MPRFRNKRLISPTHPSLIPSSSVKVAPLILTLVNKFLHARALAILWKNLVFLSPSLNHTSLEFCLHDISSIRAHFLSPRPPIWPLPPLEIGDILSPRSLRIERKKRLLICGKRHCQKLLISSSALYWGPPLPTFSLNLFSIDQISSSNPSTCIPKNLLNSISLIDVVWLLHVQEPANAFTSTWMRNHRYICCSKGIKLFKFRIAWIWVGMLSSLVSIVVEDIWDNQLVLKASCLGNLLRFC